MSFIGTRSLRRSGSARALLVFFAFTAPLGIVAHLLSEFAGLGAHDDADVLFSARHAYLALIAIGALAAFAIAIARSPRASRRARVESIVARLPFGGCGVRFVALAFAAQFAFFALTQIGEGCPLCNGDVVTGAFAAAFASLAGALFVALGKRRVVELVFALVHALAVDYAAPLGALRACRNAHTVCLRAQRCAFFVFRNRPPPTVRT